MSEIEKYSFKSIKPEKIYHPQNSAELSDIFKYSIKNSKKVIILGNNSQHHFSEYSEIFDIVISTSKLNKIVEYNIKDFTITAEAGVTLFELQKKILENNQLLPVDPMGREKSTIAGIVAMNDSGSLQYGYGSCKDLILGMNYVLPDGTIAKTGGKTVKNVAGYDMTKLFIGSMGTFGAITNITWKLLPVLPVSKILQITLQDFDSYSVFVKKLMESKYTFSIVDFTFVGIMKLFIKIEGEQQYIDSSLKNLENDLSLFNNSKITEITKKYTDEIFSNSQDDKHISFKIFSPFGRTFDIIKYLIDFGEENKLPISLISHVGNGIVKVGFEMKNKNIEICNIIDHIRLKIKQLKGRLIITELPSTYKKNIDIWDATDSEIFILQKIKKQLDPEKIIANGRFIGGL